MSARFLRRPIAVVALCIAGAVLTTACTEPEVADQVPTDELWQQATLIFKPLPEAAPNPDNPVTQAKVELGEKLYFDQQLSKNETISCNSCHSLATFGVDNLPFSPGDDGELGGRNSPTVLNAALHGAQFWDGRAANLEEQAGMPILNPVEMAIPSKEFLVERLENVPGYPEMFAAAFPEDETPLSYENITRALAAFERTLLTPSRFDAYLEGDIQAITDDEKEGLRIFKQLGCTACHNGMTIGGHSFRKFGLSGPYWEHTLSPTQDEGRYQVTGEEADRYVFKVASLRNIEMTYPYFHDGSIAELADAVRVMAALQIGADLSDNQAAQLASFLKTLTGELPEQALEAVRSRGGTG
jgi:cytochrome c peroxidase